MIGLEVCLAAVLLAGPTSAEAKLGLPRAMPLEEALLELASESGWSMAFPAEGIKAHTVLIEPGETGYSTLSRLLDGTSYTFERTGWRTVRIIERKTSPHPISDPRATPHEVILVRAQYNDDILAERPVGITTIEGEDLSRITVPNTADLTGRLPNLAATRQGLGRNKLVIRGISDGAFLERTEATTGVYLDGLPMISTETIVDLRPYDLETVTLERGPAFTRFGGAGLGGVLALETKMPSIEHSETTISGSLAALDSGAQSSTVAVTKNIPFSDHNSAIRLVGYAEKLGGYIDNPQLETENINGSEVFGGRASFRHVGSNSKDLDVIIAWQNIDQEAGDYSTEDMPFQQQAAFEEPYNDRLTYGSIRYSQPAGDADLTMTAGAISRDIQLNFDATSALPFLSDEGDLSAEDDALGVFEQDSANRRFVYESRLSRQGDDLLSWQAGAFLAVSEEKAISTLTLDRTSGLEDRSERKDQRIEAALFNETVVHLPAGLSVFGGVRASVIDLRSNLEEIKSGEDEINRTKLERRDWHTAFTVGASHQLARGVELYTEYSTGFRAGGFNLNGPLGIVSVSPDDDDVFVDRFNADDLRHAEAGIAFSRTNLSLKLSAYKWAWQDIQAEQVSPTGSIFVANVGDGTNIGIEGEIEVQIGNWLSSRGGAAYNKAELDVLNPLVAEPNFSLPIVPKVTAFSELFITQPIRAETTINLGLRASYVGKSPVRFTDGDFQNQGPLLLVSGDVSLDFRRISAAIFVQNALNRSDNSFAFGNPFSFSEGGQETPLRPREIGMRFQTTF